MRLLVATAVVLAFLAGCSDPTDSPPAPPATPADDGTQGMAATDGQAKAPAAADRRTTSFEGRYRAIKPLGEKLQEEGGETPLSVPGWSDANVTLDSSIEVDLVLLPPGCSSAADPCAIRFSPPEDTSDGTWNVGSMQAGAWTVVVEADEDDYSFVDGVYGVEFSYLLA